MRKKRDSLRIDGAKIRSLRRQQCMTQDELARKSGITKRTLSRIENGEEAHQSTLGFLSEALAVRPDELRVHEEAIEMPLTSDYEALKHHLRYLDEFIKDRLCEFGGRGFVFDELKEFVKEKDSGYFFIYGDPGIGKSSVAAWLTVKGIPEMDESPAVGPAITKYRSVSHFNNRAEGTGRTEIFLQSICAQLILHYGLNYSSLPADAGSSGRFLMQLLREVSDRLNASEKAVIVVDALDEVDDNPPDRCNVLHLPVYLPRGVFIVATVRSGIPLPLRIECDRGELTIKHDLPENLHDIETYLKRKLIRDQIRAYMEGRGLDDDTFIGLMKAKSEGNFMYLRYVLPEIAEGAYRDLDCKDIPTGLQDYYEDHWRRMKMTSRPRPDTKIRVIYVLCELRKPIRAELLAECCQIGQIEAQAILDEWEQFLHKTYSTKGVRYSLYHSSFAEFLHRKPIVQAACVNIKNINRLIARWLWGDLDDE